MRLNGNEIPDPENDMQIDPLEIVREDRTASGRKVKDIITEKDIFTLQYAGLLPLHAKIFIDARKISGPVEFEYEDVEGEHTKQVYVASLPRSVYLPKPQYTKDITITLEEE